MRNFIIVIINLFILAQLMGIAEPKYSSKEIYPLGVGPFIAIKGGVNTLDSPDGIKNGFKFNSMPDFGAQVYIPFGLESNIGGMIDLAFISYNYKFREYNNDNNNWTDKVSYFIFSPNLHFSGFIFGFNFGFPLSASSGNKISGNNYQYDFSSDNLKFLADIHGGGLFPLYVDNFGRLNLYIQAEYPLSVLFKTDLKFDNYNISKTKAFNVQPVAIKIGLSYIFNTTLLQQ